MRRTCRSAQAPQVLEVEVERFLRNADSESVRMQKTLTFEFAGEVVGNFPDIVLVLLPGDGLAIGPRNVAGER